MTEINAMADPSLPVMNVPGYYGLLQMNRALLLSNNEIQSRPNMYSFENANFIPFMDIPNRNLNTIPDTNGTVANHEHQALLSSNVNLSPRAKRTFVPNEHKDVFYWMKRLKNNVSARRSRVKRKVLEQYMGRKLAELQTENDDLKRQIEFLGKACKCSKKESICFDGNGKSLSDIECKTSSSSSSGSPAPSFKDTSESDFWSGDKDFCTETSSSSEETDREIHQSTRICMNSPEIQRVPHKVRLKLHLHSAFSKN